MYNSDCHLWSLWGYKITGSNEYASEQTEVAMENGGREACHNSGQQHSDWIYVTACREVAPHLKQVQTPLLLLLHREDCSFFFFTLLAFVTLPVRYVFRCECVEWEFTCLQDHWHESAARWKELMAIKTDRISLSIYCIADLPLAEAPRESFILYGCWKWVICLLAHTKVNHPLL